MVGTGVRSLRLCSVCVCGVVVCTQCDGGRRGRRGVYLPWSVWVVSETAICGKGAVGQREALPGCPGSRLRGWAAGLHASLGDTQVPSIPYTQLFPQPSEGHTPFLRRNQHQTAIICVCRGIRTPTAAGKQGVKHWTVSGLP